MPQAIWLQNYDPLHNAALSTLVAAIPVILLLGSIAFLRIRIHLAAVIGLLSAMFIAWCIYGMPVKATIASAVFGGAFGLFPIGWIILNLIFFYQLTVEKGLFKILRAHLATIAPDPRIQLILIAFCFGAFFEGAAGFGTPVAVTAAILIQLGFRPLQACGLSLIANTAPVAFGALGTPILALSKVTGLDPLLLSKMVGRQLPFFSVMIPFWVVWAMVGFRATLQVWPAALTAGLAFAIPQFLISNFHGPWLVDIVASISSIAAVVILLKFWKPKTAWTFPPADVNSPELKSVEPEAVAPSPKQIRQAWMPWVLLSLFVFVWGIPAFKNAAKKLSAPAFEVASLHNAVARTFPVVPMPTLENPTEPEAAVFTFDWISATGTGILIAAICFAWLAKVSLREFFSVYAQTLMRVRFSLLTIAAMLGLGYVTKYSGADATLGLALAKTGALYPFFGTMLGWLGVALTGSDTASNVLFGSLQTITAKQTGVSAILMSAANSSGGVMGKMVDAQSIVVASTATNWYGGEGKILRYVFFHSLALATLVGILVFLQAKVFPFIEMVVK
jgi:lactate permease